MEEKLKEAASRLPETALSFDDIQASPKKKSVWPRLTTIAASLLLLLGVSFGAYGCAAEIREYNAAVEFFEENDLPTEGLSRSEIKAVYRDITTATFTYSKTAEVLQNSMTTEQVGGYNIWQEEPTPEDVEKLWNAMNSIYPPNQVHYVYHWDSTEKTAGGITHDVVEKSHFAKMEGETLVWDAVVTDFRIEGYKVVSDGLVVYGEMDNWFATRKSYPKIAKIDNDGNVLWTETLDNGFENEYIAAVVENEDGSYAVFSRGDFKFLCCSRYTAGGRVTEFQKTEIGNYGIRTATRLGDDYIVLLFSYMTNEHAKILKVDSLGNVTESFSYSGEDAYYYITDMIEFDGEVYLSAYSVPRLEDEGGRDEIAGVLKYLFDNQIWEMSSEELTPRMRDNYTAMLLICDPNGGKPREFYSVKGSLGGSLSVSEVGQLKWDVESIVSSVYSPMTSAYTLIGHCSIFEYTFDDQGALVNQEKTDRTNSFWR